MAAALVAASVTVQAQTLENVKRAGELRCGVEPGLAGFSNIDSKGEWHGLDVDICRAVATVALGDPRKVKFVALTPQTRLALVGFRGGEARTGKLGCKHLVREQRRE